jgi:site-specific DNA-methyltransferase (cytosine-N4-specific)
MGGAYEKGRPVRSLYQYRYLIGMVDEVGFRLAEDFYWFNSAKLPSPIEWVNKRKLRAKDAVNNLWWFAKNDFPKADVTRVLAPFSDRMKKLMENPVKWYTPKKRPSGHDIGAGFAELANKEGAIPSNLLQIPNTESNSQYLRYCRVAGVAGHPARFPERLPEFFIKFLTDPGDTVLDIFAGSNTTGAAAERLGRKWLSFEIDSGYVGTSLFRFLDRGAEAKCRKLMDEVLSGCSPRIKAGLYKNGPAVKRKSKASRVALIGETLW